MSRGAALLAVLGLAFTAAVRADERTERIDAAHVQTGQRYRWKLAAGKESVWEVVSKTADSVRYRILSAGPDEVHVFSLVRKPESREPASGDKETLVVSGVVFPCTVLETELAGTLVKTWRADRFPEVVKIQLGQHVVAELAAIDSAR